MSWSRVNNSWYIENCYFELLFFLHSSSNCRFCLQKFQDDEKQVEINQNIRKQFFVITQIELKTSQVYSDQICETCFNSVRNLATFKTKLVENQQKLEEAFKYLEDGIESDELSEDKFETEAVLVKVEMTEDKHSSVVHDDIIRKNIKIESEDSNEGFEFMSRFALTDRFRSDFKILNS